MIFQIRLPAGENQRFGPGAFDNTLNKPISIKNVGEGFIFKVEIVDEGNAAILFVSADADERFAFVTDCDFFSFEEPFHIELKEKK